MQFYRDVLDVPFRGPEEADGARIVHLQFDGAEVELLEPLQDDSPIARFLAKRGPGIHHICYRVADLEAHSSRAVTRLPACRMTCHAPGWRPPIAFLHPKSTSGILVETDRVVGHSRPSTPLNARSVAGFPARRLTVQFDLVEVKVAHQPAILLGIHRKHGIPPCTRCGQSRWSRPLVLLPAAEFGKRPHETRDKPGLVNTIRFSTLHPAGRPAADPLSVPINSAIASDLLSPPP